jgi:hypothetical protein
MADDPNERVLKENYLHVDLIVPEAQAEEFERKVAEFLNRGADKGKGAFKYYDDKFDYLLVLALKTPEPFIYDGHERKNAAKHVEIRDHRIRSAGQRDHMRMHRYVHLWHVPDVEALDFAKVMRHSADDPLYTDIDKRVTREIQNFVTRVRWLRQSADGANGKSYVRVTRQFTSADLGTYLFKVGALFPSLEINGWHPLGHFQNITGPLNTVTEFWQTENGDERLASMDSAFTKLSPVLRERLVSAFNDLPRSEVREALTAAPYWAPLGADQVKERMLSICAKRAS